MRDIPLSTLSLMVMTPCLIAIGQIMFKMTGARLATTPGGGLHTLAASPLFLSALAIYGGATLVWIYVLKSVPLSYAYSFMALTFVLVPLLAHFLLGETVSWRYAAGAALIIGGLMLLWS
jgi:undecaprenyl phosphate-alpha-L-ara4N flippase subunit ArnE